MTERLLNGREIFKDVGVVKFEVVDNRDLGLVVDEFAALVKKRGVVFVSLDDEPRAPGESCPLGKIVGDAADEVTWVEPIVLKNPGQQRSRGGLSVRAAHHQRTFAPNEK